MSPAAVDRDCLNRAVGALLGVDSETLPEPDSRDYAWFARYAQAVLELTGFELMSLVLDPWPQGRWIATVDNGTPRGHAVLMRGEELVWDPEWRNPIKAVDPEEVVTSIIAVPCDPRDPQLPR